MIILRKRLTFVNFNKANAFTLIELLVVVAIIGILAAVGVVAYNGYTKSAKCRTHEAQHEQIVKLAQSTYALCPISGYTYMNLLPGLTCNDNPKSGIKKISGDGYTTKCVRQWDCTSDWIGRKQNAGLSSGYFVEHARAELNTPNNRSGYIRNDQWKNFEKAGYPERPGITNIREKGAQMRIATFLGQDCDGGNFSNSGGSYLIYDFTWP